MTSDSITVIYKWTANEGKLDELIGIYGHVTQAMEANEPGASEVQVYASPEENAIYVRDEFANADAVAYHLSQTAAPHFPQLTAIATPGLFQFFGNVPDAIKEAIGQMGLQAEFGTHSAGFAR